MNVVSQLVIAASYGFDQLKADGYYVDRQRFDAALGAVAALARLIDTEQLAPVDPTRKLQDDKGMSSAIVAARLDVTGSAVRLAARQGRLRGDVVAGRWRFKPEAVEDWEAKRAKK